MAGNLPSGYRYLEKGEKILANDLWFYLEDQTWVDAYPRNVGKKYNKKDFFVHVRKVNENNDSRNMEMSELAVLICTNFCKHLKNPKNKTSIESFLKSNCEKRLKICSKIANQTLKNCFEN